MTERALKFIARFGLLSAVIAACACAMPTLAFAEEEKSGIAILLPDMNEFIPMLVAFILVVIILSVFGFPVFNRIIKQREDNIKNALEKSEAAQIESERILEEYKEQLNSARQEATAIIAEAKQSAELVRADLTKKAQAEADNIIAKAREAIESEKKAAIAQLQGSVADLTVAVAAQVIGEDFSDADHRKLIERNIAKVGNLDA